MISAWHLLWIVPLCTLAALLLFGIISANVREEEYTRIYNEGYSDALKERNNK